MFPTFAVIDIGTLKVKLLIAELLSSGEIRTLPQARTLFPSGIRTLPSARTLFLAPLEIKEVYSSNTLTCFGCDMDRNNGCVFEENLQKTIEEIKRCKELLRKYNVSKSKVVSTHALRRAKNKGEILKKIWEETGFQVENISQEEEALLFFNAVMNGIENKTANYAIADVGGGSVQILIGNKNGISATHTMQTGAQYLHDNFTKDSGNPESFTTQEDIEKMKDYILSQLLPIKEGLSLPLVYGSSNIIDLMKAINLPLEENKDSISHPYKIYSKYLTRFIEEILPLKYGERESKYPFQKGYMWGIDKAFLNVVMISERMKSPHIIPTNANIAKGIIYSMAVKM